jgi:NitT/TauT family transport system substrate-binding protein
MKLRTITVLLLLLAVAPARAEGLKRYRVGYNNWIGYIALFVAEEKGYFKEEGLAVDKKSFSAPGDGLKPLLAGDLDAHFTTLDSTIIALDKAPGKLKVVYLTDTSAGADAIVAKKEIKTVNDLKGKQVAATVGECNHLLLAKALEKAHLGEGDIKLTNMSPDDSGAAFAAGKLDAAVTWEPWISQVQADRKGHIIFSSKEAPNLILDCVAISSATAEKKSPETKAFLRALNKANELVMKDPHEAALLAAKAIEMKPEDVEKLLPKVKLYGKRGNLEALGGGAAAPAKELAGFFKARKVNEGLVDTSAVFDSSYLK